MQGIDLIDRLAALPAARFNHLLLALEIPASVLSTESAPQLQRAVELVRYFQQDGRAPEVIAWVLDDLQASAPPSAAGSSGAGMVGIIQNSTVIINNDGSPAGTRTRDPEACRLVADEAFRALARAYVVVAKELQTCPLGSEDRVSLLSFHQALNRARWTANDYLLTAAGDHALEATWYLVNAHYIEGSLYQERNTQRGIKSDGHLSSNTDLQSAITCYQTALQLLGEPPIDSQLAAKIHFDLALEVSVLDHRTTASRTRILRSYRRVLELWPDSDLARQAEDQLERLEALW